MVSGRVVRFDSAKGYGFIAPEHGGEDVFLHVNDLWIPEASVRPGLRVEFEVEQGDRGLKASSVRLATGSEPTAVPASVSPGALVSPSRQTADGDDVLCDVLSSDEYVRDVTEVLLESAPALTAEHILQVRQGLLQFAKNRGWVEG
ncbi:MULTISPECIES: cold-shock protein [Streptomyces]|uniref:Cold-shock protein n=1 Tax=Streptomyces mutomycini TaxID=284036 RepID=A0ABW0B9J1_9ACTN|nr:MULTISPECIES: cold shock domain-containing protein [Streptomyces]KPC82972.1 DNA-binding protein [Streptomyces sp. NRRL S-4]